MIKNIILIVILTKVLISCDRKETYKDIDYIPENFLELVDDYTPLEKTKEMFGIADKIYSPLEEAVGFKFYSYFYDLQNGYLIIDTKDNKTISAIYIKSKHNKPNLKIGSTCPLDFNNGKILKLGESKFQELQFRNTVEISGDRIGYISYKLLIVH
jgi:hypothetical protein